MDLLIKLLKNAINALLIVAVLSTSAFAKQNKKSTKRPQNGILATNYIVKDLDTGEVFKEKNSPGSPVGESAKEFESRDRRGPIRSISSML